jgi:hypothetical protein
MSVHRIKNHGTWVWQARVAYRALRKAAFRPSKEAAREAEGELKAKAAAGDQVDRAPATLRQLLTFYGQDLEARGKGRTASSVSRARPGSSKPSCRISFDKPVTAIGDADVFAFRNARARYSARASEIQTQAGRLRAAGRDAEASALDRAGSEAERRGTRPSTTDRDLRTLRRLEAPVPTTGSLAAPSFGRTRRACGGSSRGGVARPRADAVALPRDRQAGGADAHADDRDPDAPPGHAPLGARCRAAAPGQGRASPGDPERRRAEDRPAPARGPSGRRAGVPRDPAAGRTAANRSARCSDEPPAAPASRTSLPRPAPPRGDHSAQQGLHGRRS